LLVQQQRGHNLNTKRFQDMVALVTGGNSGIGRATALAFAAEGARVIIAARRENLGAEVVETIKDKGGEAVFVKTDVTSPSDIENLFKVISEGYRRLDCAFNNAGRGARAQRLINIAMDEWNAVMSTNLRSVWLCMKYEIPMMVKQGGGTIVNCSSMAGIHYEEGMSLVSASKNGVLGLTRAAALEVAHRNVRVNAVCPGFIDTPLVEELVKESPQRKDAILSTVPLQRLGKPEEIAGAVLWLCSKASSFVTGKEIVIGGGQGIRA
jgi:NAD(P)-dependent dehydrogenase (short-subunit alcohol dehydrogenase family)